MTLSLDNSHFQELADEHRIWLSTFDSRHLANWERLLHSDIEAAMCEAGVRRRLRKCAVGLEPWEKLTGDCGGPDFRCEVGMSHFYVEVSCVSIAAAERKTGIHNDAKRKSSPFNVMGMAKAIFGKCGDKAAQCANLDGPALVAIGTFHAAAAMAGFSKTLVGNVLTGKTSISWNISRTTGGQVGDTYFTTDFENAAFLRRDDDDAVGFKRSSISGVVLFGLGTLPGQCLGVLHPNPARPFDPSLLPDIELGELVIDRTSRQLQVVWPSEKHN
jgi:hypothetical protein